MIDNDANHAKYRTLMPLYVETSNCAAAVRVFYNDLSALKNKKESDDNKFQWQFKNDDNFEGELVTLFAGEIVGERNEEDIGKPKAKSEAENPAVNEPVNPDPLLE